MAGISAFATQPDFFHFFLEIEFNALRFINYTIPRLCSTYAVATIHISLTFNTSWQVNSVSHMLDLKWQSLRQSLLI